MSMPDHLIALRDEAMQTSCEAWAIRSRWTLEKGIDRCGPCPNCGGRDRFAIHTKQNTFLCRRCGIAGSGAIKLVMLTQNVEFTEACEIITGRKADAPIDPIRAARIASENAEAEKKRALEAASYREKAREDGYAIWRGCAPREQRQHVLDYLRQRGLLTSDLMTCWDRIMLREHNLPFMVAKKGGGWQRLHVGPVMVAAVQLPDDRFGAVHQTWLDPTRPKGRAELVDPESGEALATKKVRGTKKGGAIRLFTPAEPRRIIMGEGIETTLTALAHNLEPDTAYWAGVDLGNMVGKARRDEAGKLSRQDVPDLDDTECFLPPAWCQELVYLTETDAPGKDTTAKVIRGLQRAQSLRRRAQLDDPTLPDLETIYIEPPENGGDLNDLARVKL